MKQMTSAEFAKANLADIDGPVEIRRYTTVMGTYYPAGYEPAETPVPQLPLPDPALVGTEYGPIAPSSTKATAKTIEDLTEEVKRLKKELASRPLPATEPIPVQPQPVAVSKLRADDPFAGLAKQDREFFERKLGTKKK